jgi:hypothetical protein
LIFLFIPFVLLAKSFATVFRIAYIILYSN